MKPAADASTATTPGHRWLRRIAIAAGALVPDLAAVAPDVPFLCDFPRGTTLIDRAPYSEIAGYLKAHRDHVETAFRTLSYFDGAILAQRAAAPALFSVGLMDQTCPPSTVFAAANWLGGPVEVDVYPFNQHEGGQVVQWERQVGWVKGLLGI